MRDNKIRYLETPPKRYFSRSFKKQVVREVESGLLSKEQAKRKYGIKGNSAVLQWCRQYGKLGAGLKLQIMSEKQIDEQELKDNCIRELEKALVDAHLKIRGLETMIEVAEQEHKIAIQKKSGTKQSKR
jgi:transposase-like protein